MSEDPELFIRRVGAGFYNPLRFQANRALRVLRSGLTMLGNVSGMLVLHPGLTNAASGTQLFQIKNSAGAVQLALTSDGQIIMTGSLRQAKGADVASANNLTLGSDGNYFRITGATQINLLDITNWQTGSFVTLYFVSNPLVKHNQVASGNFKPFFLNGSVDATISGGRLTVVWDSTAGYWFETARSVA